MTEPENTSEGSPSSVENSSAQLPQPVKVSSKNISISTKTLTLSVLCFGLSLLIFVPAVRGPFLYDDIPLIQVNPYIHQWGFYKHWFTHDFWSVAEEIRQFSVPLNYYRPLVTTSYAADWILGGGTAVAFHLVNFLWHGLVGLLVFFTLYRWLKHREVAFLLALLFAFHPSKGESVAWISGRTDIVCSAFLLLASTGIALRLRKHKAGIVLEIVATVFAYLSKESALVLPLFACVETWVFLNKPALTSIKRRDFIPAVVPHVSLAFLYLGIRSFVFPVINQGSESIAERIQLIGETMGRYAQVVFVPVYLSVQQGLLRRPGGELHFNYAFVALGFAVFAAMLFGILRTWRQRPAFAIGLLLFMGLLFPTANIIPMRMMTMVSDRFLYLPLLGLVWALGEWLCSKPSRYRTFRYPLVAVVAVMGILSLWRANDFTNERTFWEREAKLHPESLEAKRNRIRFAVQDKKYDEALKLYSNAHSLAQAEYTWAGHDVEFLVGAIELIARRVPDNETGTLGSLEEFFREASKPHAEGVVLRLGSLHIELPKGKNASTRRIGVYRPKLLISHAEIASRLGKDEVAVQSAQAAISLCSGCVNVSRRASFVFARAEDFPNAFKVLASVQGDRGVMIKSAQDLIQRAFALSQSAKQQQGPAQLVTKASELATLQAWGRAYRLLFPHRQEIAQAPQMALGFAELAFCSGDFPMANQVLKSAVSKEKARELKKKWATKMMW
jgi:tetratricopeptide (TPR) repeat protein